MKNQISRCRKGILGLKIYIREGEGRRYMIPAPLWLVKAALGVGGFGVSAARKYISEEQRVYYDSIDFKELRKGFDILKEYKGLTLVDIKSKDGTELRIII
jgi:hypothetical protein